MTIVNVFGPEIPGGPSGGDTNYIYPDMYRVDSSTDPFESIGAALQARV